MDDFIWEVFRTIQEQIKHLCLWKCSFSCLSRAYTSLSNSTPISCMVHTKTSTAGEQGLTFNQTFQVHSHAMNCFAQCYITTIKWSVHVCECDSHMQFYQQSNSREKAGVVQYQRSTFGQLLRLASHRSAVQTEAWIETLSSSSCICIWCRLLADFSRRTQHRGWLWTQQNFADRIEHPVKSR